MRLCSLVLTALALSMITAACSKKKEKGDVSASLMKTETVNSPLALKDGTMAMTAGEGSMVQSFTPKSLKLPIFRVSLCQGSGSCTSIYTCAANSIEGCGVELSEINAFVDALNASATAIEDGQSFDHIGVQFCEDGDTSGIQHVKLKGTVTISGAEYGTSKTSGLSLDSEAEEIAVNGSGGCASYYPLNPAITVSKDNPTQVKLFFDASLYAYAGVAGGASSTYSYPDGGSGCAGSSSAYVCAPVITIVGTVDSGNPTTEHYLLADTSTENGGTEDSAPTASVALYFSSEGNIIGGVQNPYRLSGSDVNWGHSMNGGLGLLPKEVDANTVSFGEPEGSISLADWFKEFKRATHSGNYIYAGPGGKGEVESTYKATKL